MCVIECVSVLHAIPDGGDTLFTYTNFLFIEHGVI